MPCDAHELATIEKFFSASADSLPSPARSSATVAGGCPARTSRSFAVRRINSLSSTPAHLSPRSRPLVTCSFVAAYTTGYAVAGTAYTLPRMHRSFTICRSAASAASSAADVAHRATVESVNAGALP
jgi:hypothetical protein